MDTTNPKPNLSQKYSNPYDVADETLIGDAESAVTRPLQEPEQFLNYIARSQESAWQHRMKTSSVIRINSVSLKALEFYNAKENRYNILPLVNQLNEKLHPDVLLPDGLPAQTEVRLAIDADYKALTTSDSKQYTDEFGHVRGKDENASRYLSPDKKSVLEDCVDNVPIKVIAVDGSTLGWLPRIDWVDAEYPGEQWEVTWRNVEREIENEDGSTTNNLKIQQDQLRSVRRKVAESYNACKGPVATCIESKGAGTPIYNREVNLELKNSRMVYRSTAQLLPDPTLQLAIVDDIGSINIGYEAPFAGAMAIDQETISKYKNLPVALIPGANGQMFIAPLLSRPLFDPQGQQSDFNTIVRAFEIFIGATSEDTAAANVFKGEAKAVEDATGFDITTEAGLRDFINQYITYTTDFKDSVIGTPERAHAHRKMEFLMKIEDKLPGQTCGSIKIGTAFSCKLVMKATLVNGKLDPKFVQKLKEGIGGRYKNVSYAVDKKGGSTSGINKPGSFTSPKFRVNGVWEFTVHDSYNDYVKFGTRTNVVGTNKLGEQYVYAVRPQIQLDMKKILESSITEQVNKDKEG